MEPNKLEAGASADEDVALRQEELPPTEEENIELELNRSKPVVAAPNCELPKLDEDKTFDPKIGDEQKGPNRLDELSEICEIPLPP